MYRTREEDDSYSITDAQSLAGRRFYGVVLGVSLGVLALVTASLALAGLFAGGRGTAVGWSVVGLLPMLLGALAILSFRDVRRLRPVSVGRDALWIEGRSMRFSIEWHEIQDVHVGRGPIRMLREPAGFIAFHFRHGVKMRTVFTVAPGVEAARFAVEEVMRRRSLARGRVQ